MLARRTRREMLTGLVAALLAALGLRPRQAPAAAPIPPALPVQTYCYDAAGPGHITTYTYDAAGTAVGPDESRKVTTQPCRSISYTYHRDGTVTTQERHGTMTVSESAHHNHVCYHFPARPDNSGNAPPRPGTPEGQPLA